ncbi:hypothetical protein V6R21_13210 [Limibacter armeniacum]|uniref:hypothetical protein n=1 Tax=Limibacter armeniacum TaxID=466084 RepID=UPI002FE5A9E0
MELSNLNRRDNLKPNSKQQKLYQQFENLIQELQTRTLPNNVKNIINNEIEQLNQLSDNDRQFSKKLAKAKSKVIATLDKELKIVLTNHYRNTWMVLGMSLGMVFFGLPMGTVFSYSLENMAFLGMGLPLGLSIGLSLGLAFGSIQDKKAAAEGRQLSVEFSI